MSLRGYTFCAVSALRRAGSVGGHAGQRPRGSSPSLAITRSTSPRQRGRTSSTSTSMPATRASCKSARRASAPVRSIRPSPSRWTTSRVASGCSRQQTQERVLYPALGTEVENAARAHVERSVLAPARHLEAQLAPEVNGDREHARPRPRHARYGARARASGRTSDSATSDLGPRELPESVAGERPDERRRQRRSRRPRASRRKRFEHEAAGRKASTARPVTIALNESARPRGG